MSTGYLGNYPIQSYTQDGVRRFVANSDFRDGYWLGRLVCTRDAQDGRAALTGDSSRYQASRDDSSRVGVDKVTAFTATTAGAVTTLTTSTFHPSPWVIVDTEDYERSVAVMPIRPGLSFAAIGSKSSDAYAIQAGDFLVRDDTDNHLGTVKPLARVTNPTSSGRHAYIAVGIALGELSAPTVPTQAPYYRERERVIVVQPHRFGELIWIGPGRVEVN